MSIDFFPLNQQFYQESIQIDPEIEAFDGMLVALKTVTDHISPHRASFFFLCAHTDKSLPG